MVRVEVPLEMEVVARSAVRPMVAVLGRAMSFAGFAAFLCSGEIVAAKMAPSRFLAFSLHRIVDVHGLLLSRTQRRVRRLEADVPASADPATPFTGGESVAPGQVAGGAQ